MTSTSLLEDPEWEHQMKESSRGLWS
jgi:hypothetical protein